MIDMENALNVGRRRAIEIGTAPELGEDIAYLMVAVEILEMIEKDLAVPERYANLPMRTKDEVLNFMRAWRAR